MDCWKWSTMFRRNLEWKQWPEENVEKLVWNNEEISWSSGGRFGRGYTNWEGLWCKCAKLLQSCPTFCNPMDCNPPGSSVLWILQARILEWVAISFSRDSSSPRDQTWDTYIADRILIIVLTTRDYSTDVHMVRGWKHKDCRRGVQGDQDSDQLIHSQCGLCVTLPSFPHSFPPSLPLSCCGSHFWAIWKC